MTSPRHLHHLPSRIGCPPQSLSSLSALLGTEHHEAAHFADPLSGLSQHHADGSCAEPGPSAAALLPAALGDAGRPVRSEYERAAIVAAIVFIIAAVCLIGMALSGGLPQ